MAYSIQRRRHYYEGTIGAQRGWQWVSERGDDQHPDEYPTIEAARERIREYDAGPTRRRTARAAGRSTGCGASSDEIST
jgi:hypothetical protein